MWMAVGLVCLLSPVPGPVSEPFAPVGAYAGHWGVDIAASAGTPVVAPVTGTVTFAGSVAGMRSVTIEAGAVKVSMSYLGEVSVSAGMEVSRGQEVGTSGLAHEQEAVHLSVRLDGSYVDPGPFLRCRFRPIAEALRLVPYPGGSANRTTRRHLRPAPSRPSAHGRGGLSSTRLGSRRLHARRRSLAKSGTQGLRPRAPLGDDPPGRSGSRLLRSRRAGGPPRGLDLHRRHPGDVRS